MTSSTQRERIKQQRQETQRKRSKQFIIIATAIVLIILAIVLLPQFLNKPVELVNQAGFSLGDPAAPVKVEEFSDFRCSHCRTFSESQEPGFIEKYVDTGKVYLTFNNFAFLSPDSLDAAEATFCAADQNGFWQYKAVLFKNNTFTGAYAPSNLLNYAKQAGLDADAFQACLESDQHVSDVESSKAYGSSLGVNSTPQFSVNGTLVYSTELEATVDAALAGQ